MTFKRFATVALSAFVVAACGDDTPTNSIDIAPQFDEVDPVVALFNATYGLPDGPFSGNGHAPFLGGMGVGNGQLKGPKFDLPGGPNKLGGMPLPDSLRLTVVQKAQIVALIVQFNMAKKPDLEAMMAAHRAAKEARKAGKPNAEVFAILQAARPSAERVHEAAVALRLAILEILTPAQRAWIDAHRPTVPVRSPD